MKHVLLALSVTAAFGLDRKICDVTKYGAKTSQADNAKAIQAAIDACISGGEVTIPKGTFKTNPLKIQNGRDFLLTFSKGATLQALPRSRWPMQSGAYVHFLQILNCQHCTVQGHGILDGRVTQWYIDFDQGKIKA